MKTVVINNEVDRFKRGDRVIILFWDIDGTKVRREGIVLRRLSKDNFYHGNRYNILTRRNDGSRHITLAFDGNISIDISYYRDKKITDIGI